MNNVRFMSPSTDRRLEIELQAAYIELKEAEQLHTKQDARELQREVRGQR